LVTDWVIPVRCVSMIGTSAVTAMASVICGLKLMSVLVVVPRRTVMRGTLDVPSPCSSATTL
jgi:hypothetical protein